MTSADPEPRGRSRPRGRRLATVALVGLLLAVGCAGAWRVAGGRWFVVSTPSMGTAAPVGTLLWVEPVSLDDLVVGDVITFHPPTSPERVVTHRIVGRAPDGTLLTKGDINRTSDAWTLGHDDLVGRVQMRWWGVGWLVKAMPILAGGGLLLWALLRWFASPKWRVPLLMMGAAALVSVALHVVKPLVRAELVSLRPVPAGAEATYVSAGLLPIRLEAKDAGHVDVSAGEVRTLTAPTPNDEGRYEVHVGANLPLWWWVVGVGIVLSPALWTAIVGLPPLPRASEPTEPARATAVRRGPRRRPRSGVPRGHARPHGRHRRRDGVRTVRPRPIG